MANKEHLKRIKQGVAQWNEWRKQHPEIQPDLSGAHLRGPLGFAHFISGSNSSTAKLSIFDLTLGKFSGIDLSRANLRNAHLSGADLSEANLQEAHLEKALLRFADLRHADLRHAHLSDTNLEGADLRGTHLTSLNLKPNNLYHYALLNQANLSNAKLSGNDLRRANLSGADLSEVNLSAANLHYANLSRANLSTTNLRFADLGGADLRAANLKGANVQGATIGDTFIANVDLREVKGISELLHRGPSYVVLHTIQFPQDGSTLCFLRGVGMPDEWIDDYRVRIIHPIQYHSCFICYSSKDDPLAHRLHADLQDKGVRCWFAPHDMHIGDKIRPCIDEAIHLQDKLLLILSRHSVNSDWVEHEVETALAREYRDRRIILFPIRLDDAILEREHTGWPALVQNERHIGDFTGWKDHDRYQVAFDRLIRDLKKADE